jgi:CRISPR system Cascade subunit CasC
MTTFIEFHVLRSFPPNNLNRGELGEVKTCVFGGATRQRISSQCLSRTWRTSRYFTDAYATEQLGLRTAHLLDCVLEQIALPAAGASGMQADTRAGLIALLGMIGKKNGKPTTTVTSMGEEEESVGVTEEPEAAIGTNDTNNEGVSGENKDEKTAHLLYLTRQEIDAVAFFVQTRFADLAQLYTTPAAKRKKNEAGAVTDPKPRLNTALLKKLRADLTTHLEMSTARLSVDIALFGRFLTSDEFDTINAALQRAPALGVQRIVPETDFMSAIDDLSGDVPGAGFIGETEFTSSVMYMYAVCNLNQLASNLTPRVVRGGDASANEESWRVAKTVQSVIAEAMACATPTGKANTSAPFTPAQYVEVVVRDDEPLSYADAFLKPVDPREADGDVMVASIARLARHRNMMEQAYSRQPGARIVMDVRQGPDAEHMDDQSRFKVQSMAQLRAALDIVLSMKRDPSRAL